MIKNQKGHRFAEEQTGVKESEKNMNSKCSIWALPHKNECP